MVLFGICEVDAMVINRIIRDLWRNLQSQERHAIFRNGQKRNVIYYQYNEKVRQSFSWPTGDEVNLNKSQGSPLGLLPGGGTVVHTRYNSLIKPSKRNTDKKSFISESWQWITNPMLDWSRIGQTTQCDFNSYAVIYDYARACPASKSMALWLCAMINS